MTSDRVPKLYLVSCVARKRSERARARDLYTSDWFKKARAYVERSGAPWFILLAEYGLVHPREEIEPYERTLGNMGVKERRRWADKVIQQMDDAFPDAEVIELLTGQRYREYLMDYLRTRAGRVVVPLEGMRIGEQLRWLGEHSPADQPSTLSSRQDVQSPESGMAIRDALLRLKPRIDMEKFFPVLVSEAGPLVLSDPYAFVLATCLDRGTKAEIIWTIPYWIRAELGHLDPKRIGQMSEGDLAKVVDRLPRKPRYRSAAPKTIKDITRIVLDECDGDARKLWEDRTAAELERTLHRVRGVGPGIASMAVQLVQTAFGYEFPGSDPSEMDIKPDVHTCRVLYRLGVASDQGVDAAVSAARRLRPENPGSLDGPLWYVGSQWCHSARPNCEACYMRDVCARVGIGGPSTGGSELGLATRESPAAVQGCPFCALGGDRARYENRHFVVIRDGYPVSPGHSLVVPKRHIASWFDLTDEELVSLNDAVRWARSDVEAELSPDGYNLGVNDGVAAGQTVMHLHIHLIPRYEGDQADPRGGIRWLFPEKARYWDE